MKTFFYKYLISLMLLVTLNAGWVVMAEPPKESREDREVRRNRYGSLNAHGDYSKLKLIARTSKEKYYKDEPVSVQFWVRNDSDGAVNIDSASSSFKFMFLGKVVNSRKENVSYTPVGEKTFQEQKKHYEHGYERNVYGGHPFFKLQPGQEFHMSSIRLSQLFDLSLPDTYQLTCFQINFIDGQKYEPPLQSNTVKFTVIENTRLESEIVKQVDVEKDKFDNPLPGKEVFEQKEEPKNIFFWNEPDTGEIQIIDVSVETFYKQRAEKETANRYAHLDAHGDYSKLKLIIRTSKEKYYRRELVLVKFYVRNDSDEVVNLDRANNPAMFMFLGKLVNSQKENVPYTPYGKETLQKQKNLFEHGIPKDASKRHYFFKLQPGQEFHMSSINILSSIFDLSLPDTYELTCFQINFIYGQKYEPPLQSNTVRFTILENTRFESEIVEQVDIEKDKLGNPLPLPLPGKEVFEQKEEPKNIFFLEDPNTGEIQIIDISPEAFYKRRAEKKE